MYSVLLVAAMIGQTHVRVTTAPVYQCYGQSCQQPYNRPWRPVAPFQYNGAPCSVPAWPGANFVRTVWFQSQFWLTPYQQAVSELREAKAAEPRAKPTPTEWMTLESIEDQVKDAYREMVDAQWDDKPPLRERYYQLREELADARLEVSRDMHRRRRNGHEY